MEPEHLLHSAFTCRSSGNARYLLSRHSFVSAAHQLITSSDGNNRRAALWTDHRWNVEWLENTTRLRTFIPNIRTHTPGITLPSVGPAKPPPYRCRTFPLLLTQMGHGPFRCLWVRWRRTNHRPCSPAIVQCPIHWPPHGLHRLTVLDDEAIQWLLITCPEIQSDLAMDWKNWFTRRRRRGKLLGRVLLTRLCMVDLKPTLLLYKLALSTDIRSLYDCFMSRKPKFWPFWLPRSWL